MIFSNDISEQKSNIIYYMNFYSYLIDRCKKESKEHVDNIVYLFGFIISNIILGFIAILLGLSLDKTPLILIASMCLLPISSSLIYGIFDLYSYLSKKKTYLRELEKKHFSRNFKYLIKNHLKTNNLNYEIRKEIYLFLKNNDKNNNFEEFYKFIKNKYSEENIIKLPEQKIA